jgi:hypothetical protein
MKLFNVILVVSMISGLIHSQMNVDGEGIFFLKAGRRISYFDKDALSQLSGENPAELNLEGETQATLTIVGKGKGTVFQWSKYTCLTPVKFNFILIASFF